MPRFVEKTAQEGFRVRGGTKQIYKWINNIGFKLVVAERNIQK